MPEFAFIFPPFRRWRSFLKGLSCCPLKTPVTWHRPPFPAGIMIPCWLGEMFRNHSFFDSMPQKKQRSRRQMQMENWSAKGFPDSSFPNSLRMFLLGEEQASEQSCGPSSVGDWRNCVVVSHLRYWAVKWWNWLEMQRTVTRRLDEQLQNFWRSWKRFRRNRCFLDGFGMRLVKVNILRTENWCLDLYGQVPPALLDDSLLAIYIDAVVQIIGFSGCLKPSPLDGLQP